MINPEKKCPRECKVIVNNMPEYAVGKFVTATFDEDMNNLWFYNAWDTFEEAQKDASQYGKLIVRG